MRRTCLAAAAALALPLSAPASAGKETVYYTITLTEARAISAQPSASGSVAKVDSFTVKQNVKPMTYKLDRVMVKSWSTSGDAGPPPVGTSDLTMKRGTGPAGPATGINRLIIVTTAAGGCTVGKRYPAATIVGGGRSYELSDVTITGCGRSAGPEEQITFVYGKMVVK